MSHSSPLQTTQRLWTLALVLAWLSRGRRTLGLGRCRRGGRDFDCLTYPSGYLERIRPPRSRSTAMISGIATSSFMPTTSTPWLGTCHASSPHRHFDAGDINQGDTCGDARGGRRSVSEKRGTVLIEAPVLIHFLDFHFRKHSIERIAWVKEIQGLKDFIQCTNREIDPFVSSHLEIISVKDLRLCLFVCILA